MSIAGDTSELTPSFTVNAAVLVRADIRLAVRDKSSQIKTYRGGYLMSVAGDKSELTPS